MREVDISFNEMPSLLSVFSVLQFNDPKLLRSLVFNDNAFNQVRTLTLKQRIADSRLTN